MTHDPWGTPLLVVADTVRVYCCVVGIVLCVTAGVFVRQHIRSGGRVCAALALAALAALAASAIGTEYSHLGTTVTYRLWTNVIGVSAGLIGLVWMIHRDRSES